MNNKVTLNILVILLLFCITPLNTFGFDEFGYYSSLFESPNWDFAKDSDPYVARDVPWYTVEPWELEVCRKWGGSIQNNNAEAGSSNEFLSQLTLTINAEKIRFDVENKYLYSISYYIRPLSGDINFNITLTSNSETKEVEGGVSGYLDGAANYIPFYDERNFTQAKIVYGSGVLIVPIIQK